MLVRIDPLRNACFIAFRGPPEHFSVNMVKNVVCVLPVSGTLWLFFAIFPRCQ